MSIAAPSRTARAQYARVVRHFTSTRALEVGVLQASPMLGVYLGGLRADELSRAVLLLLGSLALTAHVFLFNDWADYTRDAHDLRRASSGVNSYRAGRDQIARVAVALVVVACAGFAALGISALLFGAGIAGLSLLYSFSPRLGKSTPIAASLNHLLGGALHFLLGYSVAHAVDIRGLALSLVFGLAFAAGHLNQEVRDYEFDLANGIGTVAVRFGRRRGFLASFCLFSTAYALIVVLAAMGALPKLLLATALVWVLQAAWSFEALRRGLGVASALWMQRRYRLLFALIGLAMLVR
jgi:4-hydroxybenzoate polyprenyltransferase